MVWLQILVANAMDNLKWNYIYTRHPATLWLKYRTGELWSFSVHLRFRETILPEQLQINNINLLLNMFHYGEIRLNGNKPTYNALHESYVFCMYMYTRPRGWIDQSLRPYIIQSFECVHNMLSKDTKKCFV